jgi:rhomboid family GlyGly-CTERM serine protease
MNSRSLGPNTLKWLAAVPMTLVVAMMAIIVASFPPAGDALQFDRAAIAGGELWRLATAHVAHWNFEHLQWDLLMFVVLGAACEVRDRRRMWLCTVLAAACVSLLVFCLFPGIETYRGLSGIDTALFTLLAIDLMRDALQRQRRWLAIAIGGLLVGFVGKSGYEAVTGHALFVDQAAAGFELLVWDHVVAAVVGTLVAYRVAVPDGSPPQSAAKRGSGPAACETRVWNCA